jgi:spore coat protein U domain-containing protein, fimbrial subunit CupE1/2/3/6
MAAVLLVPGVASALNCSISLTPLSFGMYAPAGSVPLDAVSNITVRCVAQPGTYAVTIGPGLSGNQLARTMSAGGSNLLSYNLYRDPGRTQIWGDGTPPTFVVTGTRPSVGQPTINIHPIYGRVFSGQTPNPGNYADNLLVTVLF